MTTFRRWADPVRGANQPTPILANGPEQYDFDKVGPCAVVQIGPRRMMMLYEGIDPSLDPGAPGGDLYNAVCHATSTDFAAWTKRGRIMTPAASPSWENSENCPTSLVWDSTNSRWVLFFHGGNNTGPRAVGFAYAPDLTNGGVWTKYASNPVLQKGGAGAWDELFVADAKVIVVSASLWIMFYVGRNAASAGQIGRATSTDQGATWTKDAGNPVLAFGVSGSWDDADIHAFCPVRVKSDLMVAYYVGRETIPGGNSQLGRAYSYDEGVTWVRDVTNPVLSDASDDDLSDSVEVLAEGNKHHIYYGQFDFVGQTLRGKGYATAALSALPRTEALDLVERADDATPPPGASWANPAAGAGTAGLVVLGRALAHNGSGSYRVTSVWNQQFPGGNPEVWIEFQQVSDGNFNEGFALHICHHNPATTTDAGKGGQGWTLDVEHGVTNDLINMYPLGAAGGAWTAYTSGKAQVGDIYIMRYTPGGNVQCIRIRNGVETVLISRAYNALPDDRGGLDFGAPYQPAKDGQPFWLKMDLMRNNENRIKTFGGGTWAALPTTFHGRA